MKSWSRILFSFGFATIVSNAAFAQDEASIAEVLENDAEFSQFFQIVEASEILESLGDAELSFTVFAPTDEAFAELDADALLEEAESIVLYHLVDGELLVEDFEDGMEVESLSGAVITIGISDDEIRLNGTALLLESIEASNGLVHRIDSLLEAPSGEACMVFTEDADTVQVRVGPGENRGVVAFLPADVEFEVLGQATDNAGEIWFKLDKEQATPNRSNAEAWVAAADVESLGNCADVLDVNAPPVIPIVSAPTANPTLEDTGESPVEETPVADTGIRPNAGSWTVTWASTTNASCTGTGNVSFSTSEVLGYTVESGVPLIQLNNASYAFMFFGTPMQSIGNGVYQGYVTYITSNGSFTGTLYIDQVLNANQMVGRFIVSWDTCSATLNFTASHA